MTEKRFKLHITWLNNDYEEGEAELKDGSQPLALFDSVEDARLLQRILNELDDENKELNQKLEDCKFAHRTEMAHHRVVEKELKETNDELKNGMEIVKEKLLNYILDYKKIGNDNWNMGLSESVETLQEEVKDLFKNPFEWEYEYDCDDCKCFKSIKGNYDEAICGRYDKKISYFDTACDKFEWK